NMGISYYQARLGDLQEQLEACAEILTARDYPKDEGDRLMNVVKGRLGEEAFWMASRSFDQGDLPKSNQCLAFAVDLQPALRDTKVWGRFQAKKLIGAATWRRLQPIVTTVRRLPSAPSHNGASHFRCGQLTGWWPGDNASA